MLVVQGLGSEMLGLLPLLQTLNNLLHFKEMVVRYTAGAVQSLGFEMLELLQLQQTFIK